MLLNTVPSTDCHSQSISTLAYYMLSRSKDNKNVDIGLQKNNADLNERELGLLQSQRGEV